jgi:hypothetical protein
LVPLVQFFLLLYFKNGKDIILSPTSAGAGARRLAPTEINSLKQGEFISSEVRARLAPPGTAPKHAVDGLFVQIGQISGYLRLALLEA